MAAVYKSLSKTGTQKGDAPSNGVKKNKQRVLILSSRGVTYRHRHLLNDIASMMPHSRKDAKFDSKSRLNELNELAELYNCNNVLFFEARKGKDLYVWLSKVPNGPTVKMHLQNLHTMEELHFTGNCLKGSRPILSFDAAFDKQPHLRVIKELFLHTFGVPQGARKSKPFIDHVMGFSFVDGKIWVRNYQINEQEGSLLQNGQEGSEAQEKSSSRSKTGPAGDTEINLIEIGPRFVLTPIVIQEGSFGGPIIYENREFISPNQLRADLRKTRASKHNARAEQTVMRLSKKGDLGLRTSQRNRAPKEELDTKAIFS
ncbi:Ribosome biogenesis protein BRX1 [Hirsutella minnesotensis 3608]|nr:Ribosome biogenesis protein BRX1 [Hirsutella minnesotensis 3608]